MTLEPAVAREIREFHAPYWRAWTGLRAAGASIEETVPELRSSLASLFEQGYSLTDVGMMLGLTRERVRQYAVRFSLPRPMRNAARIWSDERACFVALSETAGRRSERLGIEKRRTQWMQRKQRRLDQLQEHFWTQVAIPNDAADACWIWRGTIVQCGPRPSDRRGHYGSEFAHRVSFLWTQGYLPIGRTKGCLLVAHSCDNGLCVNPEHLMLMTHQQNIQDAIAKGRHVSTRFVVNDKCKLGHDREVFSDGRRRCRICVNRYNRESYYRRKAHKQKAGAA